MEDWIDVCILLQLKLCLYKQNEFLRVIALVMEA